MGRRSESRMKQKQREEKKRSLTDYSTVDVGQTCLLESCCREVRLGATPCKVGNKISGYNTLSDKYEEWEVVVVNQNNHWQSIVKRVL